MLRPLRRYHIMKTIILATLVLLFADTNVQDKVVTLKFQDLSWRIPIPQDYRASGSEAASEAETQILFRYEKDSAHYIEAYSEYFDEKTDGNYAEAARAAKQEAVDTTNQMLPGSTTLTRSETIIDGLTFLTFTTKLVADADFTLHTTTFTRLFKRNTLTITVYYADAEEGKRLTDAVLRSVFRK